MLFPILEPSSLSVVVAQHKIDANKKASVLKRYDRHSAYNISYKQRRRLAFKNHKYNSMQLKLSRKIGEK